MSSPDGKDYPICKICKQVPEVSLDTEDTCYNCNRGYI